MTYVTEQTSAELRAHMRRLQAMPGWHEPLADRLHKEIVGQDAEIKRLRALLDHALIRDVLGYVEDAGPADVWGAAQAWMALRDAPAPPQGEKE